jgi:hypothetical protein
LVYGATGFIKASFQLPIFICTREGKNRKFEKTKKGAKYIHAIFESTINVSDLK